MIISNLDTHAFDNRVISIYNINYRNDSYRICTHLFLMMEVNCILVIYIYLTYIIDIHRMRVLYGAFYF